MVIPPAASLAKKNITYEPDNIINRLGHLAEKGEKAGIMGGITQQWAYQKGARGLHLVVRDSSPALQPLLSPASLLRASQKLLLIPKRTPIPPCPSHLKFGETFNRSHKPPAF